MDNDAIPNTDTVDAGLWAEAVAAAKGEAPADPKPEADATPPAEPEAAKPEGEKEQSADAGDIWENASEGQRRAFADLQHRLRSNDGRVGALQRQINDLTRQLQEQARLAEPKAADDWAAFEKDYPDEAKAFKALQAGSDAKIQALQQQLENLATPNDGQFYDLLDAVRPDWREIVNAPDFSIWLSAQDEPTQAKINSSKISDATALLRAFDAHRDAKKAKADQLKQTREQRASHAQAIPGSSSSPSLDDDVQDSNALWHEAVASVKRRRAR